MNTAQPNRELNRNNSRIHYLQAMIDTAVVISAESKNDEVGLFDGWKLSMKTTASHVKYAL